MRSPLTALQFLFLLAILVIAIMLFYFGMLTIAFEKLGLSPNAALLLLVCTLFGGAINLPLFSIDAEAPAETQRQLPRNLLFGRPLPFEGKTLIAINVGGALIPIGFSLYLLTSNRLPLLPVVIATAIVSAICYAFSRPVPGLGIGIPMIIAPFSAALAALSLLPDDSAPLAYICGTLGVLIGADLLRLGDIRKIGTPVASIGGAGTFDGIFLTGIVAALLA